MQPRHARTHGAQPSSPTEKEMRTMAELAINGGTPVRATGLPRMARARRRVRRRGRPTSCAAASGAGSPSPASTRPRSRRRSPRIRAPRHGVLDDERHRHDGGGLQGARHRVGRRGHRARAHVLGHGVRAHGGGRAPRVRRRHRRRHGRSIPIRSRPRSRRARRRSFPCIWAIRWPTWTGSWRSPTAHGLAVIEDCAHAHGQQWKGLRAPAASATSARSATSPRRS